MIPDDFEDEARARSRKTVERYMERRLFTKGLINNRFQEIGIEGSLVKGSISPQSPSIHDPLPKETFLKIASQIFCKELSKTPDSFSTLHTIALWHAAFPFPVGESDELAVKSLAKAVAVLEGPLLMERAEITYISRTGPTTCTIHRGREAQDRWRLLFRSMADKVTHSVDHRDVETVPVVESVSNYSDTSFPNNSLGWQRSKTTTRVVHQEDERHVDLVDAMSFCYPYPGRSVGRLLRSSFHSAVKSLPHYPHYLNYYLLRIETLRGFVRLILWPWQEITGLSGKTVHAQSLTKITNRVLDAFITDGREEINWTTFSSVTERQFPHLFDSLPRILLAILKGSIAIPSLDKPFHDTSKRRIIHLSSYTQIRSFLPIQIDELLYEKTGEYNSEVFARKLSKRSTCSILLVQGHSAKGDNPNDEEDVVVGVYVPGSWTSSASFPSGPKLQSTSPSSPSKRTIIFQLSPVHRVYRARFPWPNSGDSEPMLQARGITFGRPLNGVFEFGATAFGHTYLALDETMDRAAFEHGKEKDLQGEFEGSLPYGSDIQGEIRFRVDKLEVWRVTEKF